MSLDQLVHLEVVVSKEILVIQVRWEHEEPEVHPDLVVCPDQLDLLEKMVSVESLVQLEHQVNVVMMVFPVSPDQRDIWEKKESKVLLADQVNRETRVLPENLDLKDHPVKRVHEVLWDSRDPSVFLDHRDLEEFPDFKE